jgi:hypothetical protein
VTPNELIGERAISARANSIRVVLEDRFPKLGASLSRTVRGITVS